MGWKVKRERERREQRKEDMSYSCKQGAKKNKTRFFLPFQFSRLDNCSWQYKSGRLLSVPLFTPLVIFAQFFHFILFSFSFFLVNGNLFFPHIVFVWSELIAGKCFRGRTLLREGKSGGRERWRLEQNECSVDTYDVHESVDVKSVSKRERWFNKLIQSQFIGSNSKLA